ncbi:MAG: hypothetical protein HYU39_11005 [Thaumarchaeota archaeon]|nr:hypothetical protein [Nitrososphaerota archaeon]
MAIKKMKPTKGAKFEPLTNELIGTNMARPKSHRRKVMKRLIMKDVKLEASCSPSLFAE